MTTESSTSLLSWDRQEEPVRNLSPPPLALLPLAYWPNISWAAGSCLVYPTDTHRPSSQEPLPLPLKSARTTERNFNSRLRQRFLSKSDYSKVKISPRGHRDESIGKGASCENLIT